MQIDFAPALFVFEKSFQNPNYFVSDFVYLSDGDKGGEHACRRTTS